jgi:diguanylate cyclase (GGDEF)-like protein
MLMRLTQWIREWQALANRPRSDYPGGIIEVVQGRSSRIESLDRIDRTLGPWRRLNSPQGRNTLVLLLSSVTVTATLGGIRHLGALEPLERVAYDRWMQLSSHRSPDSRMLLVEITEADIKAQQQWPMSDQVMAEALGRLQQLQPKVIGLDVYRNIPHGTGGKALGVELRRSNVLSITQLGDLDATQIPPPPASPPDQVGFNDFLVDPDGILRRQLLYTSVEGQDFYAFSLLLVLHYLQQPLTVSESALSLGRAHIPALTSTIGGYQNVDSAGYQTLVRYRSDALPGRSVTLGQVLAGQVPPEWVKGKIVMIGLTAPSSRDFFDTPLSAAIERNSSKIPGVMIHGESVRHLLSLVDGESPMSSGSDRLELLWALAWAGLGSAVLWRFTHPLSSAVVMGGGWLLLGGVTYGLFLLSVWVPIFLPGLAFTIAGLSTIAYRVFQRTFYDPLTGLANRSYFAQLVEQAQRRLHADRLQPRSWQWRRETPWRLQRLTKPGAKSNLAVLFIDLDRFRSINENLGYSTGDRVLVRMAQRLQDKLPRRARLARLSADEFAILLPTIANSQVAIDLAERLQRHLAAPLLVKGYELSLSGSVGIAVSPADRGLVNRDQVDPNQLDPNQLDPNQLESSQLDQAKNEGADRLLRDAQTALFRAKTLGKARHELFSTSMQTHSANRFEVEQELRQAIAQDQLLLHYQPFVDLVTGDVAGFEALVRWQHPTKGMIPPFDFIPIAEESGLILPLGQWVLESACRQTRQWQLDYPDRDLVVGINLSGVQFSDENLVAQIRRLLIETEVNPRSIKLELTESMLMTDVDEVMATLFEFRELQMTLGLDDFGTGYSSLSQLHRFPFDTLKIDRSFVMDMDKASENEAIVKTIITLGHALHMNIIAEGVETAEQAAHLRNLGCELGQGYFFARPLPVAAASELLATPPRWQY